MKAMKQILLSLVVLLALSACASKELPSPTGKEQVHFSIDMPDFSTVRDGGLDESGISNLELWVFDRDGHFVEKATATLTSQGSTRAYTASITPCVEPRIIHFVANASLTNESEWIGRDEMQMLPSFKAAAHTTIPMWARKKYNSVQKNSDLGAILLLRNMTKCNLIVDTDAIKEATYSIYNTLAEGTLAPFDPSAPDRDQAFKRPVTIPTEPAGVPFANNKPWHATDGASPFYVYERDNTLSPSVPCLILKAKFGNDADFSYYKIDFVDKNDKTKRHHLLRNHYFKVTIKDVRVKGYATPELALAGAAANNIALSDEVQMYPSFSDGLGRLEIDKTFFSLTNDEREATFNARYFPNQTSSTQDNSKLTVRSTGDAVTSATVDASGKITLHFAPQPGEGGGVLTSDVVVGVSDNEDLKRLVRVEVRRHYEYKSFKANDKTDLSNVKVSKTQGASLKIEFVLPDEFSEALLPITFRVFTDHFYPSNGQGFSFQRVEGRTCYEYTLSKPMPAGRRIECNLKSNKSGSAETIEVRSVERYFAPKEIHVTN